MTYNCKKMLNLPPFLSLLLPVLLMPYSIFGSRFMAVLGGKALTDR